MDFKMRYGQTVEQDPKNTDNVLIKGKCQVTKKDHSVSVPKQGFYGWKAGQLIQQALPTVSSDDREFLVSGTSPEGWAQLFPPEEE